MKKSFTLALAAALLAAGCSKPGNNPQDPADLAALAGEAYIYALPAVEHNKAVNRMLQEVSANTFVASTHLYTHSDRLIVTPNNDTYYSRAVLDLRTEPVVVGVPAVEEGRYFSIQLIDVFTGCPEYIGTLATGNGGGNYLVAPRDWNGATPAGIDGVIRVQATLIMALARTQVFGTDDAPATVIAQSYTTTSLSEFAGTTPPSGGPLEWTLPLYDARTGDAEGFFRTFNAMVQYQLLTDKDKALMKKFAALGVEAGANFDRARFTNAEWAAIEAGVAAGNGKVLAALDALGTGSNYWKMSPKNAGRWEDAYLVRALAAWQYIYVNTPEEAVYFTTDRDGDGEKVNGANRYTITFTREQIPQVGFFWSLTMYGSDGFLIDAPNGRYNIKDRDALAYGEDGSLTLYVQYDSPGAEKESNWLPAPEGEFYMALRLYGASEETISGAVSIPAVVKE